MDSKLCICEGSSVTYRVGSGGAVHSFHISDFVFQETQQRLHQFYHILPPLHSPDDMKQVSRRLDTEA